MYRKANQNQLTFENFYLPFGGHLCGNNRWVILSEQIPWRQIEETYGQHFCQDNGSPAKTARIALGALIIKERKIKISMSGRGRCFDNILAERLWRTVKYEEVYLREYNDGHDLIRSLRKYFEYYNYRRPHRSLDNKTPALVYQTSRRSLCSASATPSLHKATELNKTLQLTP